MIGIKHLSVRPGQSPKSAAAQVAGYVQAERDEEKKTGYYSERGGAPSRWLGEGARRLGLSGSVDAEVFMELLQGHLPTGEDISDRGGRAAGRRMGTDLTISAPKSFSMLVAGADPETRADLLRLWDESVSAAASVIEKESTVARLGKGGATVEHTNCMVAATFRHEDARPVDGVADMDIHSHLIHLNMTQRSDGVWAARDLDFGQRNVLRMTADFAAKAVLAKGLQERGHAIRQTKDGFELAAITDPEIRLFSRRTTQIDDTLEERGLTRQSSTSDQRDATNLATRQDKLQLSQIEQAWDWRKRLREAGINIDKMIRAARDVLKRGPVTVADLSTDAVASATRHLGERESVFSKRMTRLEALKAGMGAVTLDTVDQAIADKAAGLIDVGGDKLTTREALYREQEILAHAREGRGQVEAICTESDVQSLIEKVEAGMDEGKRLSDGQREAIRLALTTTDRVSAIVGVWGVGKTTGAVRPIVSQAKTHGFHVIGITPTTKARKELAGAQPDELMTIAAWLQTKPETRKDGTVIRDERRLIVMDEAAMVSAGDMDRVMQKLAAEGGHLVLVGDPQQLRAVSAGTPMQQMIETGAVAHVKISQVMRQTDARLREMAQVWGDGDAKGAVVIAQEYMRTVTVTEEDWKTAGKMRPNNDPAKGGHDDDDIKPTDAMVRLAEDTGMEAPDEASFREVREWLDTHTEKTLGYDDRRRSPSEKKTMAPREVRAAALAREAAATYLQLTAAQRDDTIMMTGTHILRRAVNGLVRAGLRERGEIGSQEITIRALDKSDMTEEQMARPESYQGREDLVVRLSERVDRARKDVDYKVVGVEKGRVILERLESPNRRRAWNPVTAKSAQVYVARDMALAAGDVIAFRDNAGPKDTPERVDNGEIGKILHVDKSGVTVRMEDGRTIGLDPQKRHVIDHGWAVTVHASQGATRERALYVAESAAGQDAIAQLGGVACSREKSALTILTDDQAKLSAKLEKWAVHETAMAAAKAAAREVDLETLKDLRAEAQAELGRAGDLSKAREAAEWERQERDGEVEHRVDRENQEAREKEREALEDEWELER
jgi:conjugative relaxase-like TrwC/TraI family protein